MKAEKKDIALNIVDLRARHPLDLGPGTAGSGVPSWDLWLHGIWLELRPYQWIKNSLVLAPLLFSQNLLVLGAAGRSLIAFVLFCLISSSVYLLNDIFDREQDRLHPQKRARPLAKGDIGAGTAVALMGILLLVALGAALAFSKPLAFVLGLYWCINVLYSRWLKHQVILDVFVVASGFLLRVSGGALAIDVQMSHWLLLCTTLLALFLGFTKRRHELSILTDEASNHRHVLGEYSVQFLDMMIGIVTASTVMSYALYTVSPETVLRFRTDALLLTVPFVLYGIFRYLYLVYQKNRGGDPTRDVMTDPSIIINLCLWALTTGVIIYRH